jgi:hypothetical protein
MNIPQGQHESTGEGSDCLWCYVCRDDTSTRCIVYSSLREVKNNFCWYLFVLKLLIKRNQNIKWRFSSQCLEKYVTEAELLRQSLTWKCVWGEGFSRHLALMLPPETLINLRFYIPWIVVTEAQCLGFIVWELCCVVIRFYFCCMYSYISFIPYIFITNFDESLAFSVDWYQIMGNRRLLSTTLLVFLQVGFMFCLWYCIS